MPTCPVSTCFGREGMFVHVHLLALFVALCLGAYLFALAAVTEWVDGARGQGLLYLAPS